MTNGKPTRVYMLIDFVHKRRGGISDLSMTHVRAKWIAKGTGTVMYTGKVCSALVGAVAREEAAQLASVWLAKQNERPRRSENIIAHEDYTGLRYVDVTPLINADSITDEQIDELLRANVINKWAHDVAISTAPGLDGERLIERDHCAALLRNFYKENT